MTNFAYLDFERDIEGNFFLAGTLIDGCFEQVVMHPGLASLAETRGLKWQSPEFFVEAFVSRAASRGLTIAAFSTAERDAILEVARAAALSLPAVAYCNLHKVAKRWINRAPSRREAFDHLPPLVLGADAFMQRRQRFSLASIMRLTDFAAPATYHPGQTSTRLRSTISALSRNGGNYHALTAVQKAKFTKALRHNEFDVRALPILVKEAGTDECQAQSSLLELAWPATATRLLAGA